MRLIFAAMALFAFPTSLKAAADFLFVNGRILTMDPRQPEVEALAVTGDKISGLGSLKSLQRQKAEATKVIDLNGKTLMPGMVESHGHLLGMGRQFVTLNLSGITSLEETLAKIEAKARTLKPGDWLVGRGWDQNLWPTKEFPSRSDLKTVAPKNPVFLTRVDGHAAWVNDLALGMAGLSGSTPDPAGGRILRDVKGEPTGILIDEATSLVEKVIPPLSEEETRRALALGIRSALQHGITMFHDAGVNEGTIKLYQSMAADSQLPIRVFAMLDGSNPKLLAKYFPKGPVAGDRLQIRAVKLMVDGALGSRGAALVSDYADEPGQKGLLIMSEDQIYSVAKAALESGFQIASHAIGDRANHVVLNAYEKAFKALPQKQNPRFRIEHAQIVAPNDVPRFSALGVIASMQPIHCPSDSPWAIKRLGAARFAERAYIWRQLQKSGALLAAGSDAPVEPVNPFFGLHAFITRQNREGHPSQGWTPRERLKLDEALAAYTTGGAYAAFKEDQLGKLSPGYLADLIIVDKDLKKVTPSQLRKAKVAMTMVGGEIVFHGQTLAGIPK